MGRWIPEVAGDANARELAHAVAVFESVKTAAGEKAAQWHRDEALDNHGSTVTWLLIGGRSINGFYAMAAASVRFLASKQ